MAKRDDSQLLAAALTGYREQLRAIEAAIAELRKRIGGRSRAASPVAADRPVKRQMTAEGRARIVAAQKRRWASVRKAKRTEEATK